MAFELASSAPSADSDPFAAGDADLGFVCSSALSTPHPGFELLGCAPVFDHPLAAGRPAYFAEVIVQAGSPLRSPRDLPGQVWAYNDASSVTGWYALLGYLLERHLDLSCLAAVRHTGSHLASIEAVLSGQAAAASIDSTTLSLERRRRPELASSLRVLGSWGPFPAQPVIVRRTLPPALKEGLRQALLAFSAPAYLLHGFAPVDEAFYAAEADLIAACRRLAPAAPNAG